MKKSFKILIFLMAFAFICVVNVRAASGKCEGNNNGSGPPCEARSDKSTCENPSIPGCTWKWTSCDSGELLSNGACQSCPANAICDGTSRVKCHAGYGTLSGTSCAQCINQTWNPEGNSGACQICNEPAQVNADHSACVNPKKNPTLTASASSTNVVSPGSATISYSLKYGGTALSGEGSVSYSITAGSSFATLSGNRLTCKEKAVGSVTVLVKFTPNANSEYVSANDSVIVTCTYTAPTLDHLEGSGEIWVNNGETDSVNVTGKDNDNPANSVEVDSWTVDDTSIATVPSDCAGKYSCTIKIKGWACQGTKTITVTAKKGDVTRQHKITAYTYGPWVKIGEDKAPSGHLTRDGMAHKEGCDAWENVDPHTGIGTKYNRCCGGGSSEQKVCLNCNGKYSWGLLSQNPSCTKVDSKNCNPDTETPSCYKCNGELKWGKYASNTSCTYISDKESDCEEKPYCYKNVDTGVYDWGKHENDNKWVKIAEITEQDKCTTPTEQEDPACYTKGGEYFWGKYKNVSGYTFTSLTQAQCKKFCYKEKATGNYVWGNYVGNDKYEVVASITDQNKCKAACYKCGKDYKWGPYAGDTNCEEVPKVTTPSDCDVPTPQTGLSVSNILYACGAFLVIMGSGIVVYQLTRVKKELD